MLVSKGQIGFVIAFYVFALCEFSVRVLAQQNCRMSLVFTHYYIRNIFKACIIADMCGFYGGYWNCSRGPHCRIPEIDQYNIN